MAVHKLGNKGRIFQSNWYILLAKLMFIDNEDARSRSGLCERVIRREATETEGLV